MKYTQEKSLTNFEFWSQAKTNASYLTYDELEKLDSILSELLTDPTDTEINDFFWFEFDKVCELIGLNESEVLAR